MISIVVPAHNESSVIGRTLNQWIADPASDGISAVVVCNGCTDDTAMVARTFGPTVEVVETEIASKTHALNLGDQISGTFPRFYVDADIVISADAIRALAKRLERGDVLAVAPMADIDLAGCSWLIRKYYDIRARLPSSREGIGGSGVYALSEAGRRRFGPFPDVVADDTFVRLQFKPSERATLPDVVSKVFPPRTVPQLIAVRTRAHRGTFELARRFPELSTNNGESNNRSLVTLLAEPRLWLGLMIYCSINFVARRRATRSARDGAPRWQRDETSRAVPSADSAK
ncbi:glycosyltransferase family 2 protein [Rhodopseudomonas palustris]|uniref:glycosyltransferase n=1 Tax=Rhodopseudomonas palustris TaxID=1076 RepID=UPI002ACEA95C|nr:glycosyltransferase family 2 protein [Rhodopseudomonas palustris]WQG97538.1 glycosyltransferase family 2 protein [Rhodopseudomonas palustris]